MARHWSEPLDCNRHHDHMVLGGSLRRRPLGQEIIRPPVFFVAVAGFTFEFTSVEQIEEVLKFFSTKVHQSSAWPYPVVGMSHWEAQRWYDRLPIKLLKEPRRQKVVVALKAALVDFGSADKKK